MDDKKLDKKQVTELDEKELDQAAGGAADSTDRASVTGAKGGRYAGGRAGKRI